MKTPQWKKNLGSQAGEMYVCAELSKRGIPNALLRKNFSDDDIIIGKKDGTKIGYIQVKACHPDHGGKTFPLQEKHAKWVNSNENEFVVFVWLGSAKKNETPVYWITRKKDVGVIIQKYKPRHENNRERRFRPDVESNLNVKWKHGLLLNKDWRNNWDIFEQYMPVTDLVSG